METFNQEFLEELSNSIVRVRDTNKIDILYKKVEIKPHLFKYSSVHKEKPTLFIDGIPISSKNKYKITYKCSCGNINEILLEKFVLKKKLSCNKCRETEEKRRWHGEVIRRIHRGESYISKDTKNIRRKYDFTSESDEYKNEFYRNNLTQEEFDSVLKYIYSIHGIELVDKKIVFLEHENGVNGKKYRQMVIIDNQKMSFKEIKLRCPLCGDIFNISRPIKERVKAHNFDCKCCCFSNRIFAIKKYCDGLTYQGNEEYNFIKRCISMGIAIIDGPKVNYIFNNKKHIYHTDFLLPVLKKVIEIKDNHIWHRKQIESGKWASKENAARLFCAENKYEYKLLFPQDIDDFFKSLPMKEIV